jgi:hypothetical protein
MTFDAFRTAFATTGVKGEAFPKEKCGPSFWDEHP